MTQELQIIEKIGFEDGHEFSINDLPIALQQEVEQFNNWTAQLAEVGKAMKELESKSKMLIYARQAAYASIEQAANQLHQQLKPKETDLEASASIDPNPTMSSDSEDPSEPGDGDR